MVPYVPAPVHNWFKLSESYDDPTQELKNLISFCAPAPFKPDSLPNTHQPCFLLAMRRSAARGPFGRKATWKATLFRAVFLQPDRTGVGLSPCARANQTCRWC